MALNSYQAELEALLTEPISLAKERARTAFDQEVRSYGQKFVLFGAGNMGRQVLTSLRQNGIEPLAFADNSRNKWGKTFNGLRVLSPEDAATLYGRESAFIVTVYNHLHSFPDTQRQLLTLGCAKVVSVIPFRWKYHETFLPYFRDDLPYKVLEQADEIQEALYLYSDEESRREYVAQVHWRLHGDFDVLSAPSTKQQYFPEGELFRLVSNEFFVDAGAYDGDTISLFLALRGSNFARILALEPDPANFKKLTVNISRLPSEIQEKIEARNVAVGATPGQLRFADGKGVASSLSQSGPIEVVCSRLDDLLQDSHPTYIKLDVEGAELGAIQGTQRIISENQPVIAACVYHAQDHLWKIPAAINRVHPKYNLFLRSYMTECWETVCYAVPSKRVM